CVIYLAFLEVCLDKLFIPLTSVKRCFMQMVNKVTGSLLAVFSLCLVLVNAAFADQAAEALRKHLDSMNSLEGNFTQVMTDANADVHESASGNFMLQRPGKFYWETLDP